MRGQRQEEGQRKDKDLKRHLLEDISDAFDIYISDLHLKQVQLQTIPYICECRGYGVEEWNKLIRYVLKEECEFQNEEEAKEFYISQVIKPAPLLV